MGTTYRSVFIGEHAGEHTPELYVADDNNKMLRRFSWNGKGNKRRVW